MIARETLSKLYTWAAAVKEARLHTGRKGVFVAQERKEPPLRRVRNTAKDELTVPGEAG